MEDTTKAALQKYNEDIGKISWFYYRLWPGRHYDADDLMQAGSMAVWNISKKCPEKLKIKPYVRAAIRYAIFGEMKRFSEKRKEIHIVRQYDSEIPLVDLLGLHNKDLERFEELDELVYYIKNNFPEGKKYSDNLIRLVERCNDIYDLNLSEPPKTELKDRVKIVTKLDLSDEDMVIWANLLLGIKYRFPNNYLPENFERARKYIRNLVHLIGVPPEEFALLIDKRKTLRKYKLGNIYYAVYNENTAYLLKDVFNLEYSRSQAKREQIKKLYPKDWHRKKKGLSLIEGVSNAIGALRIETGKNPQDIEIDDFDKYGLVYLLNNFFEGSVEKAVEFRFPGTYPELSDEVAKIKFKPKLYIPY